MNLQLAQIFAHKANIAGALGNEKETNEYFNLYISTLMPWEENSKKQREEEMKKKLEEAINTPLNVVFTARQLQDLNKELQIKNSKF